MASIFIEQRPALERFFTRRTGSHEAGRELVQEAWLKVQQVTAPEQVDRPVAYLFRMAGNLAVDWLRQTRALGRHVSDEPVCESTPAVLPSPEEAVQSRQEYELLCSSIRELPQRCREVFLLYRGEGLSMDEIAQRLGISAKTVEHHIAKAMVHCRARLRAAGRLV